MTGTILGIVLFLVLILCLVLVLYNKRENFTILKNNKLAVIVTTYNPGAKYIDRCLNLIEKQTYRNFDVCIVDDASSKDLEETYEIIEDYCKRNNWKFIKRTENIGPLGGRIDAINGLNPNDEDIIVSIDGDDELNNEYVFNNINKIYQDDTLITFGNYVNKDIYTGKLSKPRVNCKKHNFNKIIRNNSFRSSKWVYTHLKTFKYKVYKKINHDDLKRDGEYLKSATDLALMYPMLEMSNGKFKCVQNVLYKYNRDHPESNNKIKKKLSTQSENTLWVRKQKKYYNTTF